MNKDYINALKEVEKENDDFELTLSKVEVLDIVNEIERLNNIIKNGINEELTKELDEILKCNQRQANRINKAIEQLEELKNLYDDNYTISDKASDVIEILKGEVNE